MRTFLTAFLFVLTMVVGSTADSFAQTPFDVCNKSTCDLRITVDYDPNCAALQGCSPSFTFIVPAGTCPFNIITPCACPIVGVTVSDGINTYVSGDPAFGYPGWNPHIKVKICGAPYDIHIGPHHVGVHP